MADEATLKVPGNKGMQTITERMSEEDFKFGRVKLNKDKPRYELESPTDDDPDNVESVPSFHGVIVVGRKNFYQSDEDREAGKEAKEKREIYLIRANGSIHLPELIYFSPSSVRAWQQFLVDTKKKMLPFHHFLVRFSAEQVKGNNGYKWCKVKLEIARTLTEQERDYADAIKELVETKVRSWQSAEELASVEDEVLGCTPAANKVDPEEAGIRSLRAPITDDESAEAPAAKAERQPKSRPAETKPSYPQMTDEEDEEAVLSSAKKSAPRTIVDDDE